MNTPGSYSVWEVDIRQLDNEGVGGVKEKKLVDLKEARFINGATRLDAASETLLLADSLLGGVWEVDVETGAYRLGIQVPKMTLESGGRLSIGVDGIKVHDGYLYFSNTGQETMGRVPLDEVTGAATGKVEVLAGGIQPDDFTIGEGGLIWMAQNVRNTISVLDKEGKVTDVLGSRNDRVLACLGGRIGCTVVRLGGWRARLMGCLQGGEL